MGQKTETALVADPSGGTNVAPSPRALTIWDGAGVAVLALVMLLVAEFTSAFAAEGWLLPIRPMRLATAVAGTAAVALTTLALRRTRPALSAVPGFLTDLWRDPPGDWAIFVLGFVLATPLVALWTPSLLLNADSVRILAGVGHVQRGGFGFLTETQDNFGPHLLLGPFLALGGSSTVRLVTVISMQALAGVVAMITQRVSTSPLGAVSAVVTLLGLVPFLERAVHIPMYPAMLALGYIGAWHAYQALRAPDRWLPAIAAALFLVLSLESQPVGKLFVMVPALALILVNDRRGSLPGVTKVYGLIAVLSLPRLAVNLAEGGLSSMISNRSDYWIEKGYVRRLQIEVYNYEGVDEPVGEYLNLLPGRFVTSLGSYGWWLLIFAGVGFVLALSKRGRVFAFTCLGMMVLAVTVKQIPPFARYYSPLWPGIAILSGLAVARVAQFRPRSVLRGSVGPFLAAGALALLGFVAVKNIDQTSLIVVWLRGSVEQGPYEQLEAAVDDDRGVIGSRSHVLLNARSDIPTYGGQFLSEEEYVTYLSWPSDEAVIEMLESRDIGWVLVHPDYRVETAYQNVWLEPNHGVTANQAQAAASSPNFCLTEVVQDFRLYRLDLSGAPCPLEDAEP